MKITEGSSDGISKSGSGNQVFRVTATSSATGYSYYMFGGTNG